MTWCEHCRDHFEGSHYDQDGRHGVGHGVGRAYGPFGELLAAQVAVQRVIALCEENLAEAVGGGLTDVDTLWPSEVLDALGECWTGNASWR